MQEKNSKILVWVCLGVLVFLTIACLGGSGDAQSSPENVAKAFIKALHDGNCERAKELLVPNERDYVDHAADERRRGLSMWHG